MDCKDATGVFTILCSTKNWAVQQFQWLALGSTLSLAGFCWRVAKGKQKMFEKKNEVDEKLGELGKVVVDITPELKIDAGVELALDKDLLPSVPGGLKAKVALSLEIDADPIAVGLHFLGQSSNGAMKWVADELSKVKAGQEAHPAVAAALAAAPPPAIPGN